MVTYNPEDDIRAFYRARIKIITQEIQDRGRRDPKLHDLYAERNLLRDKLATLSASHSAPMGALADYGAW